MADVTAFIQALQQNLVEPLQKLPVAQLKALDTTHNQSVVDFQNAIGQLYAPPGPFTGKASGALADRLADYYAAENALTAYMSDGLSEHISKLIQFCQQVVSDLPPQLKDLQGTDPTTMAGTTLLTMETGATASGLNETPAVPLVQLVIVGIVGTIVLAAQTWQESKLWDAYDTMHRWEMNMSGLAAHPESSLPASPNLSQSVTVDLSAINGLTPQQQGLAKRLYNDYKSSGLSLEDIEKIIEENPNLSEAQLRELLDQYANVIKNNPNLVKKYGALAVFQEFIALAAYDAGHGGTYPLRQPVVNMPNLQEGIREAEAEMGAMESGEVPWPLTPSTDPAYDAVGPDGTKWDEKSYRSVDINGKVYDPADTVNKLQKDFGKGEKVIFDDSQLTQKEIDDTYEELKKNNQENDVVWWPTQPTQLSSTPTPTPTATPTP